MTRLDIQQLPAAQARKVLRITMALPGQSAAEIEAQISTFINHARALSLDLGRQWLAQETGRIVAACSCIESPGRTGVLFLPAFGLSGGTESALESLLAHIVNEQALRNIRLAQCLLNPDDRQNERILHRAGFRSIAELIYMERIVAVESVPYSNTSRRWSEHQGDFAWEAYNSVSHRDFAKLILETYSGSLDCPALSGLRDIEDVIAGHQSVGLFQAHRWRMARIDGQPAGCILLGENPLRRVLEVAYMGVHPDHRHRGLGRVLIEEAISLAYHERFEKVTLAVDSANSPSRRLYKNAGFVETMRRRAMVRLIASSAG